MKSQNNKIILPKLPNTYKKLIINKLYLGKLIIFKLPISYLSYLKYKIMFQVTSVSSGKIQVSTLAPINKGFGKLGKVFKMFLIFYFLFSCKNYYVLSENDRKDLKIYPESFLVANGKKHIVIARRLEITDSIRKAQQRDLAQEYQEEMFEDREF